MVRNLLRSLLAEPPAPDPPPRRFGDYLLVVLAVAGAVVGTIFEPDIAWRPVAMGVGLVVAPLLLVRRQRALLAVTLGFGIQAVFDVATVIADTDPTLLRATAAVGLIFAYALGRWASGANVAVGLAVIVGAQVLAEANLEDPSVGNYFVSLPFLFLPVALGAVMRYRDNARRQRIDEAKTAERHDLARELHDTVAHHVSAIAIQAQAGRAVAESNPEAAVDVLAVIEEAASRTLADMRRMVGTLRDSDPAKLAPQAGLAEIEELAAEGGGGPRVDLRFAGDLDDLPTAVESGLYRLTQEAMTNARRHARHATRIRVSITGSPDDVRLFVSDDGDPVTGSVGPGGFGLVGMTERAALLGGTLAAGPAGDRGWVVTAVLPRVPGSTP